MSSNVGTISVWSNNTSIQGALVSSTPELGLKFQDYKNTTQNPYVLVVIDLQFDLSDISQRLISIYSNCREKDQKLAVAIVHGKIMETEKNQYFAQVLEQIGGNNPLHRLVVVKDLYHADKLNLQSWLEEYVLESLSESKISISNKGENLIHPLSLSDFVAGLQKTLYLSGTSGKTFWLIGDPFTDLDLGYLLKKSQDDTDNPFEVEATEPNLASANLDTVGNQSRASLNWDPVDDFELKIKQTVRKIGEDREFLLSNIHRQGGTSGRHNSRNYLKPFQEIKKIAARFIKKSKTSRGVENTTEVLKKFFEISLALVASVYFLVSVSFVAFTSLSLINLESSLRFARVPDITNSVKSLNDSVNYGKIGESSYLFVAPIFSLLAPDFNEKNHNIFVFLHYSQSSLENLQQTYVLAEKVYESIGASGTNLNYDNISLALRSNLSQVYENLNQIRLLTKNGQLPSFLEEKLKSSSEFKNISLVEDQVSQILKTTALVPALLGGTGPKNVVILFQNSQELRSTGGVVDYLLAMVVEQGRIVSRNLYTSGEIDSLIPLGVEAPPLISLYTGSEDWKVRDLNYNPDFSVSANNYSAVIEKSLKFKPDVVIAVNEKLIEHLLKEDKGVVLSGQVVTSESLLADLARISPSPLYKQLIDHYLDKLIDHKVSIVSLGRVISKQSAENQILFWTSDISVEEGIVEESFAGTVYHHTCLPSISGTNQCLAETTYLSDSNFSLVPVGDGLKKKITHKVWFSEDSVKHQYLVGYRFIKEFSGLNRDLSTIIQLYAPEGTTLENIKLNDVDLSQAGVQKQKDNSLERFQIPVSLKFNVDNLLSISFSVPLSEPLRLPFAYSLTEYRQPGLSPDNGLVDLVINLPDTARASLITAEAVSAPSSYTYVFPPKTSSFGISFEPKQL